MIDNDKDQPPSFLKSIWQSIVDDQRDALRIARLGAIVGAIVTGSAGLYYFGLYGLIAGVIAGAIIGGIGLWLMYQLA